MREWGEKYGEMREALGEGRAKQIISDHADSAGENLNGIFADFSVEGLAAARSFFGEKRVDAYLDRNGTSLCAFDLPSLEHTAEVLSDNPPYDMTWRIMYGSYARAWVENADLAAERLTLLTDEERRIILDNRSRDALVYDGRRNDWPAILHRPDADEAYGMEKDPALSREFIAERFAAWRTYWGDKWPLLLKKGPDAEFLFNTTPDDLEQLEKIIPDLKDKVFSSEARPSVLFDHLHAKTLTHLYGNLIVVLNNFTPAQKAIFLGHDLDQILTTLEKCLIGTTADRIRIVQDTCSPEYIEQMLREPIPIQRLIGTHRATDPSHLSDSEFVAALKRREETDTRLLRDPMLTQYQESHPALVPFMRLSDWHSQEHHLSRDIALRHAKSFAERAIGGEERYDAQYVPSMGLEIEIAKGTSLGEKSAKDLALTELAGIPCGRDEQWEFSLEPTSVSMQARILTEMIREGWLLPEEMENGKYPLHVNIGVPEGVMPRSRQIGKLAYALMSVYTNEPRLRGGEYGAAYYASFGTTGLASQKKNVDGREYDGRIELRAFSADAGNIYRLLFDAAFSSAALFAHEHLDDVDGKSAAADPIREELASYWAEFENELDTIFENRQVSPDSLTITDPDAVLSARDEVLPLLRTLTRKTRALIRKSGMDPELEEIQFGKAA